MHPELHQVQQQIAQAIAQQPKSRIRIDVRVTAKEKADWSRLAKALDTNLSALIRASLNSLRDSQGIN